MSLKKYILLGIIFLLLAVGGLGIFFGKKANLNLWKNKKIEIWSDVGQKKEENLDQNSNEKSAGESEIKEKTLIDTSQPPSIEKNGADSKNETLPDETKTTIIIKHLVSWGFEKSSGRKINTIIIHSSYDGLGSDPYSLDGTLKEYKEYGVSPHYLIDREGKIYQLVADTNIAYHAGLSKTPDGRTNVNSFSIGIELLNTQTDHYTTAQYDSLKNLISLLKKNYSIKYVLGHSQIAPGRKTDPWNFDWDKIK